MPKSRVVHYCNQLGMGGTERTMEIFCRHLDKNRFDVFAVAKTYKPDLFTMSKVALGALLGVRSAVGKKHLWNSMNLRTPNFIETLGENRVFFAKNDDDLRILLLALKPDILHVHYSGRAEPPTSDDTLMKTIPATVTTNQFEIENTSSAHKFVKKILPVSQWLLDHKAHWLHGDSRVNVLYNPIEKPYSTENLRQELDIPADAFVIGRIGRPDPGIHDPISLQAYAHIMNDQTYFLALSPPINMITEAQALGLKNFIPLKPTTNPVRLSQFYNTLDVLAHARRDGETFGCNIAEAMMHGVPVVSHLSKFMNAQIEVIGDTGFVCSEGDVDAYAQALQKLKNDLQMRKDCGQRAQKRALSTFEARLLTHKLESIYESLLISDSQAINANKPLHC